MKEFEKLVALAFIKVKKENPLSNSKTALAREISKEIADNPEEDFERHTKTLLNHYNYFFGNGKKHEPSIDIINKLISYLGYESQKDFQVNEVNDINYVDKVPFFQKDHVENNSNVGQQENSILIERSFSLKKIIDSKPFFAISSGLVAIIILFSIPKSLFEKKSCMRWKEYRFIKAGCGEDDARSLDIKKLESFRKVDVDAHTAFFDKDRNPLIWYDKSDNKVTFFNSPGIHPTNGKTLKVITETIIRKYILEQEEPQS